MRALAPDAILHAGDIGDLDVLAALEQIAPVHAVRGNIDTRTPDVPDVSTIDASRGGAQTPLRILLTHIAVSGPRLRADAARLAHAQDASLVVCGHSHVPFIGEDRNLTIFNPGSCGPRRFALPIVFGVIDIGAEAMKMWHVDCETGERWTPPQASTPARPSGR